MIVQGVAQEADARLLPAPQQCLQAEFEVGPGEHGLDRCTGELVGGGQHIAVDLAQLRERGLIADYRGPLRRG